MKVWLAALVGVVVLRPVAAQAPSKGWPLDRAIDAVRAAGPNGKGSGEAARAWRTLAAVDVQRLPELLAGMDGAGQLAHNWLRAAIDRVLERAHQNQQPFPVTGLEAFLRDRGHDAQARRFAYELLLKQDKTVADRFLPRMLDDPSLELRRDAVARQFDRAKKTLVKRFLVPGVHTIAIAGGPLTAGPLPIAFALIQGKSFADRQKRQVVPLFEKVLAAARDLDQVVAVAQQLRALGKPVDLPTHLGLLVDWKIIGPFANPPQKGMAKVYAPEANADPTSEFPGKIGKVRWKDYLATNERGLVDLNAAVGKLTEAIAYARAEFTSSRPRRVDIRIGCYTAFKLWVNGRLLMDSGEAYAGMSLDHFIVKARLKGGKNVILLKVGQDKPPAIVPQLWQFQLRVCDSSGAAILSTTRPARAPITKKS
jgi:hypothetical protein